MQPYIVGISGGSGSGKTSFINKLLGAFQSEALCLLSQDNYYKPKAQQYVDENGVENYDLPEAFDNTRFERDIQLLMSGETIYVPEYNFNNFGKEPKMLVFHPAPIIIIEGIFIFHYLPIKSLFDLKIFIHTKDHLKIIRRIRRDQVERNYPVDDVLYRFEHHVTPAYEKYIEPYLHEADLIILNNNSFDKGLEVLSHHLKERLFNGR